MNVNAHIIAIQAQAIVELLETLGATPDAHEGNATTLLQAMESDGHLDSVDAYEFEVAPNGQLEVINDTKGWTLRVDPVTGAVSAPPENEITMPGPAPVSYYRVLVNENGQKLFRTSRMHNVGTMIVVRAGIVAGFASRVDATFTVHVLAVFSSGSGRILSEDEVSAICF